MLQRLKAIGPGGRQRVGWPTRSNRLRLVAFASLLRILPQVGGDLSAVVVEQREDDHLREGASVTVLGERPLVIAAALVRHPNLEHQPQPGETPSHLAA